MRKHGCEEAADSSGSMTVEQAIEEAERVLPGVVAPDGELDPRWQVIIRVAEFIDSDPEAVWAFAAKWGQSEDDDLRMAISKCVLEHLLEYHFDLFFITIEV